MAREVISREAEVASVRGFIAATHEGEGPAALVLEGEAGIGKSTLWLAGVEHARERGLRVVSSRPAESEYGLAYAGLGDMFDGVLDDVLPSLPSPRRRALEIAMLRRDEPAGETIDPRALATATRSALELLALDTPVVIAIDDVQWLDDASARALAFALRRLRAANTLVLLTRRTGIDALPWDIEQTFDAERVERLRVGPLSVGAIQTLLQARVGHTLPRPLLLRLHETSGGNPFYALELARAVVADRLELDSSDPLPVPESLERVVGDRLAKLSRATREALAIVSAAGRLSPARLRAAGVTDAALAPAFAARVTEYVDGVVRFAHPLLASALYRELTPEQRRRAHRSLAEIGDDELARARHLGLATTEPDAGVAAALDGTVAIAASRGASVAAAELAEHALRLTPADAADDRHQRALAAARMHLVAGDARRARTHARDVLAHAALSSRRAEALIVLSDAEGAGARQNAVQLRREALATQPAPRLQAAIHLWLATAVRVTEGLAAAESHARASLELAERLGDDRLRAEALATISVLRFNGGHPGALELAGDALDLAAASAQGTPPVEASLGLIHVLVWSGQHDRARPLLEALIEHASERDEVAAAGALWFLSLVELGAGRLVVAADHAERQRKIQRAYATDGDEDPLAIWVVARVAAHRGELARAGGLAERSRALAEGQPQIVAGQEGVLGLVAAWSGKPLQAADHFSAAEEARYNTGVRSPSLYWWRAEYIEALLELGRIEAAVDLLDDWEAEATRLGLDWVLAHATRCRGLVAAARGDVADALGLFADAVDRHEAARDPFGRARALLALGGASRRARKKRAVREAVEAAVEAFESMGAAGWVTRARAELGGIGGRTREQGLTPAERRVAALVADGLTNREVAAALFLVEHTVETHLSHVYAKLGVRSRVELARALTADDRRSGSLGISN
jgi:DNA-binding CsgD family transcriptional regulator